MSARLQRTARTKAFPLLTRLPSGAGHALSLLAELPAGVRLLKQAARLAPRVPVSAVELLDAQVERAPNALWLSYQNERYTYRDAERRVNQWARLFQSRGVTQGAVVALVMDNRPEFVFALLGLGRLRAVAALINTNLTGKALEHALGVCKPFAILAGTEHAARVKDARANACPVWTQGAGDGHAELAAVDGELLRTSDAALPQLGAPTANDVMCYIYTSGTTGLPKAAIVKNRRFLGASFMFAGALMGAGPRDVIYVSLPLYHSNAMFAGVGASLVSGAAFALRRKFSAREFWDDVHAYDATIFVYIGELCRYLLNAPPHPRERAHRLRVAVGNGLRPDIWQAFQQRFQVATIREFYGSTEGNAGLANFAGKPGMIGQLRVGQAIVRCDAATGELVRDARGFCERVRPGETGMLLAHIGRLLTFDGYLDERATNNKVVSDVFRRGDRYFNTGDLVTLHARGWVSFADRVGDTFRWKGENVSTNEVAEALNKVKGVLESNVYGVLVPGAEGRAGMAALDVDERFDIEELARFVRESLPVYQRPYFVRLARGMKITATFKHQKSDYREQGYDPGKVDEPLYYFDGTKYVLLDAALYAQIARGEAGPR